MTIMFIYGQKNFMVVNRSTTP